MEAAVLEEAGITAEVFQASLMAHQHNQLLQQTVVMMQVCLPSSSSLSLNSLSALLRRKISRSSPD
jgi:hypothetical protein